MFKTSLIYFVIRAANGVLALATIYVLTRLLSAEQYGLYALGMAGIGLCGSVLFQWIAVAVSRFYAAHAVEPDALLTEAYRLFFRIAIVGLVLTSIYAVWSPTPAVTPLLALAIGVGAIAMGLHSFGLQVANARGLPMRFGLLTASRGAFALAAAVAFVLAGFGGTGAVFGVALACVFSVAFFGARRQTKMRHDSPELRRQMVAYGLPLTLTYLATMVLDVSDRFMIGWWLGAPAVASYAAAYDLTQQVVGAIMNVLFLAAYPRVVAAWEAGGATAASQAMLPLSRAMLLGAPLITGIFIGWASDISKMVFGIAVRSDAAQIIPWVAFAIAVGCIKSYFLDIAFQLNKTTNIQVRITAAMAALNVILNLLLMPEFGTTGAAIATATAFSVGAILSWFFGRRLGIYPTRARDAISMIFIVLGIATAMHLSPTTFNSIIFDAVIRLLLGLTAYIATLLITDLAGARSTLIFKIFSLVKKLHE